MIRLNHKVLTIYVGMESLTSTHYSTSVYCVGYMPGVVTIALAREGRSSGSRGALGVSRPLLGHGGGS